MITARSNNTVLIGVFTSIGASLCCITPVLALISGTSGLASTFSWLEPLRPWLIGGTVAILGFAWYQIFKRKPKEDMDCDCETEPNKTSFMQSKKFLGIITVFAALMLTFPSYSNIFYPNNISESSGFLTSDSSKFHTVVLDVKGMTCSGCEIHIVHEVGNLEGVKAVEASYTNGTATVEYSSLKLDKMDIVNAINLTGYTVIEKDQKTLHSTEQETGLSFYIVPMVCNAAPTIGCGSRSKPVLKEIEKIADVIEVWLNRSGTVIAVVWNEGADYESGKNGVNKAFAKHQVNANELSIDDYKDVYGDFMEKENWLKGSDVDQLSREEAGIIADQILIPIKEKTAINSSDGKKLKEKITDIFYDFFLNFESMEELGDPEIYRAKLAEIILFGEDLLGSGNMPSVDELWNACSSASKSCDHEGCSDSCKSPRKS